VRPDQALAIAQAFEKLIDADDRNNSGKNNFMPAAQPPG
jgi:hypothetical protein